MAGWGLSWGSSDPVFPSTGPHTSPGRPRRRRQERTVYSAAQRAELEQFFAENQYPTYQERETLAARLSLQEHQVQVCRAPAIASRAPRAALTTGHLRALAR